MANGQLRPLNAPGYGRGSMTPGMQQAMPQAPTRPVQPGGAGGGMDMLRQKVKQMNEMIKAQKKAEQDKTQQGLMQLIIEGVKAQFDKLMGGGGSKPVAGQ